MAKDRTTTEAPTMPPENAAEEPAKRRRLIANQELKAMNECGLALDEIEDDEATSRVLHWVLGKYAPAGFQFRNAPQTEPNGASASIQPAREDHMAVHLLIEKQNLRRMTLENDELERMLKSNSSQDQ